MCVCDRSYKRTFYFPNSLFRLATKEQKRNALFASFVYSLCPLAWLLTHSTNGRIDTDSLSRTRGTHTAAAHTYTHIQYENYGGNGRLIAAALLSRRGNSTLRLKCNCKRCATRFCLHSYLFRSCRTAKHNCLAKMLPSGYTECAFLLEQMHCASTTSAPNAGTQNAHASCTYTHTHSHTPLFFFH